MYKFTKMQGMDIRLVLKVIKTRFLINLPQNMIMRHVYCLFPKNLCINKNCPWDSIRINY